MSDFIFLDENAVQISCSELVIHGTSYSLENIASFRLVVTNSYPRVGWVLILIGFCKVIWESEFFTTGGFLLVIGLYIRFNLKPAFSIVLLTVEGLQSVFTSRERLVIDKILAALDLAMIANRRNILMMGHADNHTYI